MIETILLDAGGVLVNPNWERVADALAAHGITVSAAELEAVEPRAKRELDTGETVCRTDDDARGRLYFDLVLRHAGEEPSPATAAALRDLAAYHARGNLWESVRPDVPQSLDRLRAGGYRLGVVSNANGTLLQLFVRLGLAPRFDVLLDSFDVGVEKPSPRIFQIAIERLHARPETTLHAGDLYHVDVVGARAAGLEAWLVDEAGLYADHDCVRVESLAALADRLLTGR